MRSCAEDSGIFVLEVKTTTHKDKLIVDVAADAKHVLTIDDYATLSRSIDKKIAERHPGFEKYELRVGSPGIERPLEYLWQFEKNVGRKMKFIVSRDGQEKALEMRLKSIEADTLRFEDGKGAVAEYLLKDVRKATVQIEF